MANLKTAGKVYFGTTPATKVYAGSTLIWEEASAPTPTMEYWFDAEGGTIGNPVLTSHDYGVPFSSVSAGNITYSANGKDSNTCLAIADNTASDVLQWNNPSAVTSAAIGFWFKPGALASVDARIFDLRETSSSGTVGGILWVPEGRFRLMQATIGLTTGQSPIFSPGSWYWVSLYWNATTKIGRFTIHDETGTSLHDSGNISLTTSYTQFTTVRFGRPTTSDIGASFMDMLQFDPGATAVIPPWLVEPAIPKPSALNTGYNPATIDGTVTGTQWLSTPGQILENKIVNGRVVVQADNVTIRNCYIRGAGTGYPELVDFRENGGLIEYCTIEPTDSTLERYNGVSGSGFTARYNNISKTCDGFRLYNPDSATNLDVVVEYNFVHDLYYGPDPGQDDGNSHNDGVQIHGPGYATIRYNYFEMLPCASPVPTHTGGTAALIVGTGAGMTTSQHGIIFSNNWMTGNVGAFVNLGATAPTPTTVTVQNNIIDKSHPGYDPSYDIVISGDSSQTTPGLPTSTGYDTNNGNVDEAGNPWYVRVW